MTQSSPTKSTNRDPSWADERLVEAFDDLSGISCGCLRCDVPPDTSLLFRRSDKCDGILMTSLARWCLVAFVAIVPSLII
jgi:hypothetical protein